MSPVAFTWSSVPIHVIDFEGSARTGVVEFGVATLLGGEVVSASTRLHASRVPVPAIDTQCHGLGAKDLKGLPPFELLDEVADRLALDVCPMNWPATIAWRR